MKIEKKYQGTIPTNKILNEKTNSNTDTYSCDYINNLQNNIYSTEEQMIGTYLGKPLYRRVFVFNEKIGGTEEEYIDIETNINPDEIELIWIDHSASFMYNIENSYNLTGGLSGLAISTGIILKKFIRIFCNTEWNTSWTKVITALYTKTTD